MYRSWEVALWRWDSNLIPTHVVSEAPSTRTPLYSHNPRSCTRSRLISRLQQHPLPGSASRSYQSSCDADQGRAQSCGMSVRPAPGYTSPQLTTHNCAHTFIEDTARSWCLQDAAASITHVIVEPEAVDHVPPHLLPGAQRGKQPPPALVTAEWLAACLAQHARASEVPYTVVAGTHHHGARLTSTKGTQPCSIVSNSSSSLIGDVPVATVQCRNIQRS